MNLFFSETLTYDDVLLEPSFSEILPHETDLSCRLTKSIELKIPFLSSAMDTVTESETAIVMAQQGGMGVIHKNLSPQEQALEVLKVKKYESTLIQDPITVREEMALEQILPIIKEKNISGLLVVDGEKKLKGIITRRDLRFANGKDRLVKDLMQTNLIVGKEGISRDEAITLLKKNRIEKLPIVNDRGELKGLMTIKDIENHKTHPYALKDSLGRLRVAAAIGVGELEVERALHLIEKGVDALVLDTAHGHSAGVRDMVQYLKSKIGNLDVGLIVGNVATQKAAEDLIKWGADAIKVGIGPGSICTTRIVAGIGVPQLSALLACRNPCLEASIPYIADGGIKYSGDIVKALAAGASCCMLGSMLAGTRETPGEVVLYQGRSFKVYRGMGSIEAMRKGRGSRERYGQGHLKDHEREKLVPEGIEGQVPFRGSLADVLYQLSGGLRSGMGYVGAKNLVELREKGKFIKITAASLREGHPHDIMITKEAPNYSLSS